MYKLGGGGEKTKITIGEIVYMGATLKNVTFDLTVEEVVALIKELLPLLPKPG